MADDARNTIAEYVLSGNLRDASKPTGVDPGRQAELRARLQNFREGATAIPGADSDPGDFRAAVEAREDEAALIAKTGKELPRWQADKQPMKALYIGADGLTNLPTPGGLGALILVIVLFFFILIPATSAGETRALLLWEVLIGKKQILSPSQLPVVDGGSGKVGPNLPNVPSIPIPNPIPGQGPIPWNPITGIIPLSTHDTVGGGL